MFQWYTSPSAYSGREALIIDGPLGQLRFPEADNFEVVEAEDTYVAVSGQYEEELILQEGARKYRVQYYSGCYFIEMVSGFTSDFGPQLGRHIEMAMQRKGVKATMTQGHGSAGFLFDGGPQGTTELFVPDFCIFEDEVAALAMMQQTGAFIKIPQVPWEVESLTDTRKLRQSVKLKNGQRRRKLCTHEKCLRYLDSAQVVFCIAFYPRTKHVVLYSKDAQGRKAPQVFRNPEAVPLKDWPNGILEGTKLYLSPLRERKHLWSEFSTKEKLLPTGLPASPLDRLPPVDPQPVKDRQAFYERELSKQDITIRIAALVHACRRGDAGQVDLACSFVDSVNKWGQTDTLPAVAAAVEGHIHILEILVAQGADLNLPDLYGITPMYAATMSEKSATIRFLINQGVAPHVFNGSAIQDLLAQLWPKEPVDEKLFNLLLSYLEREKGREGLLRLFYEASGSTGGLKAVLKSGAVITAVKEPRYVGSLHHMIMGKLNASFDFAVRGQLGLLDRVGLLDVPDGKKRTVLMKTAGDNGDAESTRTLLQVGVATDLRDEDGNTAFDLACKGGHWEVVEVMLDMKVSIPPGLEDRYSKLRDMFSRRAQE
eukprot:TRINITY_DN18886_c0_g1_i1.p1 TRINITY_DN18886_c0_g1~~TRINITY_DN18886_c0_g1_i1.p1  ORF type:complete len:598 (+),score=110.17 TRINITY_DN18886_c0_g1_i1:248-2041(+)